MTRPNHRWSTEHNNPGMDWEEMQTAFLRSRRLGIHGAHRAARPRTLESYQGDLKHLFDFMRSRQITLYKRANERDFLDFIEHLRGNGWSPATQRHHLISLKAFLRWVERDPDCKACQMPSFTHCIPRRVTVSLFEGGREDFIREKMKESGATRPESHGA